MPLFLGAIVFVWFAATFPRASDFFAWCIALGVVFPICSTCAGTAAYCIINLFSLHHASWLACYGWFGLPFGMFLVWHILGD